MATKLVEPVDEKRHERHDMVQWWLEGTQHPFPGPRYPMEDRFIHHFISEAPFFDWSSKNGLMWQQARNNADLWNKTHDREQFEALLRSRPGLEFMVVGTPEQAAAVDKQPSPGPSGVWVIRKQERLSEKGPDPKNPYPHVEVRGTYYVVNVHGYQAPSVIDLVSNRLLGATGALSKAMEIASGLPYYTPTTGNTYLPPTNKPVATSASTAGSPSRSREGSVMPGIETQSLRSGSVAPPDSQAGGASAATGANSDLQAARLLAKSFQDSIQFGDDYMDDNPLLGEPGSFKFTSSTAAVKKRRADEEAAAAAAQRAKEAKQTSSGATSPKLEVKAATPPAVFSEAKAGTAAKTEKEKKEERKRRRKSRPAAGSGGVTPTTPGPGMGGSALAAGAGG